MAFDFKNTQDANHLACSWLVKINPQWATQASGLPVTGWWQLTQRNTSSFEDIWGDTTASFCRFSGVLGGHHSWNVGYSTHPEKQLTTWASHWFLWQSFFHTWKVMIPGHAKREHWGRPVCVTATSEHCHLIDLLVLLTIGQQVDCLASLPEKGVDSMISIWHDSWGKPLTYCPQNHKCKSLKISSNGLVIISISRWFVWAPKHLVSYYLKYIST